jgi:MoxR-like ATPase
MKQHVLIQTLRNRLKQVIVGQEYLLDRLVVVLLAHGHILVEGAPGILNCGEG